MSETMTETRPRRKQLADQLDRFDEILDGLADGLTAAVTDAAREGTRDVVKEALLGALRDPEFRALFAPPAPPVIARKRTALKLPHPMPTIRGWYQRVKDRCVGRVMTFARANRAAATALEGAAGGPIPLRGVVLVACLIGLTSGVVCLFAPLELTAALTGTGAAGLAVGVQLWCRMVRSAAETAPVTTNPTSGS